MQQYNTIKRVSAHFRKRQYDDVLIPKIILEGNYLQTAGFEIGDKINVCVSGGMITIQKGGAS